MHQRREFLRAAMWCLAGGSLMQWPSMAFAQSSNPAMLQAKFRIYDSTILDAPIEEVWPFVRDLVGMLPVLFGDGITDYRWLEGGSAEKVPSKFQFKLVATGETVVEVVVARSELDHSLTYRMIGQAVGITDNVATYQLRPIVTGKHEQTFIDWVREFAVVPGRDPQETAANFQAITKEETLALQRHFKRSSR